MTLNINKTHALQGLLGDAKCVYALPFVSNTDNDNFVYEVATWATAYAGGNLYGTKEDSTTFKFDGIDQFPVPPKR